MAKKRIILIDGNSLAYRAFFALPDTMKTSKGQPTNALYGFTTMLLKILDQNPDLVAISFDKAAPTFRHKEFAQYKATRPPQPQSLYSQMAIVREIARAFDIPVFELEGYEADDIIGTIAKKAEDLKYETIILTGDLDTLQLVSDNTKVQTPRKGISDTVTYDKEKIKERYHITPEQIPDFKALKGDPSDNIPGVPGIGEKGASTLIQEFGSLENLIANIDKIKSKKNKEALQKNIEKARLSKYLATIVTDVPLEIDLEKALREKINWPKILPLFETLEFEGLLKKYGGQTPLFDSLERKVAAQEKLDLNYQLITSEKDLSSLIAKLEKTTAFAFDTETTGEAPFPTIAGLSLSFNPEEAFYIPAATKLIPILKPIFENENIKKYGHNLKYDIEVLSNAGIKVHGIAFDTMIAAYLLNPTERNFGLKKQAAIHLDRRMISYQELVGKEYKDITEVPLDLVKDYACADADTTFQLVPILRKQLKEKDLTELFEKIELPLIETLIAMEQNGISIDEKALKKMAQEVDTQLNHLETQIYAIAGEEFNINSPKQLAHILFEKLQIPPLKRTKTGPSTDASVLEELSAKFEIAAKLLEYRQLSKLKSTYIDVLPTLINPKTKRIHTSFNQTITATGRLSSSNPNLQNIPIKGELGQRIRQAFVPQDKEWSIISADYSQVELRILAHLSGDKALIIAFKKDEDIHAITAAELGIKRDHAKMVNFGIVYGMSDFGLAKGLGIKKTDAQEYIEKYFEKYPGVKKYIENTLAQAHKDEFVTTMMGRRRYLPEINSRNPAQRNFAERTSINTPVQGTAADLIKIAMINIHQELERKKLKTKMILQVHDELVFEVPPDELEEVKKLAEKEMTEAIKLRLPIKVDLKAGKNWGVH